MITAIRICHFQTWQTPFIILQERLCLPNEIVHKLMIVYKWLADPLSVQLLSFNFDSRAYAYTKLAQGLNNSVTRFNSIFVSYLDSCLGANLCRQFTDDIGCGVETFEEMGPTIRQIFDCLRKSGLRLTPHKCEFGMTSIDFLGSTITSNGLTPETAKLEKLLKTMELPATVRQVKRLVGFLLFFSHIFA